MEDAPDGALRDARPLPLQLRQRHQHPTTALPIAPQPAKATPPPALDAPAPQEQPPPRHAVHHGRPCRLRPARQALGRRQLLDGLLRRRVLAGAAAPAAEARGQEGPAGPGPVGVGVEGREQGVAAVLIYDWCTSVS